MMISGPLGMSSLFENNVVSKISMKDVAAALSAKASGPVNVPVTPVSSQDVTSFNWLTLHVVKSLGRCTGLSFLKFQSPPKSNEEQMTNGGTGPYNSSLVLITSGRGSLPPSIVLVNYLPPYNTTVVLDNFFGRQFNSLNDIKIHPTNGKFFFTDVEFVLPCTWNE